MQVSPLEYGRNYNELAWEVTLAGPFSLVRQDTDRRETRRQTGDDEGEPSCMCETGAGSQKGVR